MLRRVMTLCVVAGLAACSRTEELSLVLRAPLSPDPFADVRSLRLTGLVGGGRVDLGSYRWDQGPFEADFAVPANLRRLVVEGLDAQGRVLSSAVSEPLDVVLAPADGPLELLFTRIGVFSQLEPLAPGRRALTGLLEEARWFVGGLDPAGCPLLAAEVLDRSGRLGERVPDDDTGFGLPKAQAEMAGGVVMAVAPPLGPDCTQDTGLALFRFDGTDLRRAPWPETYPEGAAMATVGPDAVALFGGVVGSGPSTQVLEIRSDNLIPRSRGQLDRPLTQAAAARVPGGRVALIGGRTRLMTDEAVDEASLFSLDTFTVSGQRVPLVRGRIDPQVASLRGGTAVVAGGRDRGQPVGTIEALSVPFDPGAIGVSEPLVQIRPAAEQGLLVDLDDGSLLWLPLTSTTAHWVHLLPLRTESLPAPDEVLVGGRLVDGLAFFRGESGAVYAFNAGPQRVLMNGAPRLVDPGDRPMGWAVVRPGAWSLEDGALVGTVNEELPVDPIFRALVILSGERRSEFDLVFEADLQGVAAVVFGLDGEDFDQVVLLNQPRFIRSPELRIRGGVECTGDPEVVPGPLRVRVRRSGGGRRVDLDLKDDRDVDLSCIVDAPTEGSVGLGLLSGQIRVTSLSMTLP